MTCCGKPDSTFKCAPDCPRRELTFAEAMALDPSDVEFNDGVLWRRLADNGEYSIDYLRMHRFRRARPKRSRVQEMAARKWPRAASDIVLVDEQAREEAMRAVCHYLRTTSPHPSLHYAREVEREFLEPR